MKQYTSEQSPHLDHVELDDEYDLINEAASDIFPELMDVPEADAIDLASEIGEALTDDPRMAELAEYLAALKTHEGPRAAIVHGLVEGDHEVAATPDSYLTPEQFELMLPQARRIIVLGIMGVHAYGYSERQQPGKVHNEVIAIPEHFETTGISANPTQELGLHVEDTYLNTGEFDEYGNPIDGSPDWLTIFMMRNNDRVATTIAMPDVSMLPDETVAVLREASFFIARNATQVGVGDPEFQVSIMYGPDGNPFYRVNTANLELDRYTEPERSALNALGAHSAEQKLDVELDPGDLLLVDNKRVLHGRALYGPDQMPKWDGADRYQSRVVAYDNDRNVQFESAPRLVSQSAVLEAAQAAKDARSVEREPVSVD